MKKVIALALCLVTLGLTIPVASADGGGGPIGQCIPRIGGPTCI